MASACPKRPAGSSGAAAGGEFPAARVPGPAFEDHDPVLVEIRHENLVSIDPHLGVVALEGFGVTEGLDRDSARRMVDPSRHQRAWLIPPSTGIVTPFT